MATRNKKLPKRSSVPSQFRGNRSQVAAPAPVVEKKQAKTQQPEPFTDPALTSKPQHDFIRDLFKKRDLTKSESFAAEIAGKDNTEVQAYIDELLEKIKFVPKPRASDIINALKALPNKQRAENGKDDRKVPQVPEGHYALHHPQDELNPVRFYKVSHGKDLTARGGKNWEGAIFVDRYASDDTFAIKYRSAEYFRVLNAIAEDPLAAAVLYGNEFERCCICNRGLTRRLSREMGIGPVCARRQNWVDDAFVEGVRAQIIARGDDPDEKLGKPKHRQHIIDHE